MSQYAIFIVALSQAVTPFELPSSKVPARTAAILRAVESAGTDVGREAAAVALARSPLAVSYYRASMSISKR
jgi:hypothetical protein